MRNTEVTDFLWRNYPQFVRAFVDARPNYLQLSEEIAYILERLIRKSGIEFASVTFRAKSLDSFCEKVFRKNYKDPLKEITDLAGVRVVFLYLSDRRKLEKLIEKHFSIAEKIDKVDKTNPDRFGYGALHYSLQLSERNSGARYDELKNLVCEVQVRTVLQDAWAIIGHHLSYKQESQIPKALRRKLNALSGLFETADDQFNHLQNERSAYYRKVKRQIIQDGPGFLKSNVNLDDLIVYLRWRFPEREQPSREAARELLETITKRGLVNLAQVDKRVFAYLNALKAYESKYPPVDEDTGDESIYTATGAVRVVFNFEDVFAGKPTDLFEERRKEFLDLVDRSALL